MPMVLLVNNRQNIVLCWFVCENATSTRETLEAAMTFDRFDLGAVVGTWNVCGFKGKRETCVCKLKIHRRV